MSVLLCIEMLQLGVGYYGEHINMFLQSLDTGVTNRPCFYIGDDSEISQSFEHVLIDYFQHEFMIRILVSTKLNASQILM